jgi:hypothetical protein
MIIQYIYIGFDINSMIFQPEPGAYIWSPCAKQVGKRTPITQRANQVKNKKNYGYLPPNWRTQTCF